MLCDSLSVERNSKVKETIDLKGLIKVCITSENKNGAVKCKVLQ